MGKMLRFSIIIVLIFSINFMVVFSTEGETYGQLLHNLDMVHGIDDNLAESNDITRSEMIVLLVRMLVGESQIENYLLPEIPSFTDAPSSHWAYAEIEIAKQMGIASGLGDGTFGINNPVTYTQAVLFLSRALEYDTSNILYKNSVYFVRETTGLTLSINVGPNTVLKRGQVFELISHALNKNRNGTDQLLVSVLELSEDRKQQFLTDYKEAVQGYTAPAVPTGGEDFFSFENGYKYSSYELYSKAIELVERYPQILEMEILGYSTDARPIYVLRMTNPINENSETSYVDKMHFFVDAGTHARETYNPFLVLRIVEDYAKDYYNDAVMPAASMKAVLENNVLHFMPLVNPDGFDIVKFGPGMIKDSILKDNFLQLLGSNNYQNLKANVRGVDLNRNYADEIFDTNVSLWKSLRGILEGNIIDYPYPNIQFYSGTSASSEIETRISEDYMLRYDFRGYLSYHSQGRIVYAETSKYGLELETQSKQLEALLSNLTGYRTGISYGSAYGYANRFAAFNTYKTLSTIETMNTTSYPDNRFLYKREYTAYNLNMAPLALLSQARKEGYAPYKIYVNDRYVRDINNKPYSLAIAERLGGIVVTYSGKPVLYLKADN